MQRRANEAQRKCKYTGQAKGTEGAMDAVKALSRDWFTQDIVYSGH